jgi:hypothetical protein
MKHVDTEMTDATDSSKFIGWNQTRDANDIDSQFFHNNGLHVDISDDQYLPQTGNNEGDDVDYHYGTDNRFVAIKSKVLNKDQRIARQDADADSSDEDRADEHAVNFIENTTTAEVPVQHVAAVLTELPATAVNHQMWNVDLLGPDHWKLIGYPSFEECEKEFKERCGGFDTITGRPKFTARQIKLDLDKFGANYMRGATYNVDEFGISSNLKDNVKNVEKNISSK